MRASVRVGSVTQYRSKQSQQEMGPYPVHMLVQTNHKWPFLCVPLPSTQGSEHRAADQIPCLAERQKISDPHFESPSNLACSELIMTLEVRGPSLPCQVSLKAEEPNLQGHVRTLLPQPHHPILTLP